MSYSKYYFDFVKNNPDKPWNWYALSGNPNITWDIVRDNPDKPWNWYALSGNPNITWDIVRDNPDKPWKWYGLSKNKMVYQKKCREAVAVIENRWLEKMYAPTSNYVKTTLKDHFENLKISIS